MGAQRIIIFQSRLNSSYPLLMSQQIYHKPSFTIVFLKVWSEKIDSVKASWKSTPTGRVVEGGSFPCGRVSPTGERQIKYGSFRLITKDSLLGGYKYFRDILIDLTY